MVLVVALGLTPAPVPAQDPQDHGTALVLGGEVIAPLEGGFTTAVVELDFDLLPPGEATISDIQVAFPTAALGNITLTPPTAPHGSYLTQACGRALGDHPDGALRPHLVDPPDGAFGAVEKMVIELTGDTTEAGVLIADWRGPVNLEIFDDGARVGAYTFDTTDPMPGRGSPFWFESSEPFDEIRLSLNPQHPAGNWVVCSLWLPEGVPTLPRTAFRLLVLLLVAASAFLLLRR